MRILGTLCVLLSLAGAASATAVTAPEIDGYTLGSGVALAAGLLLVARGRRK